MAKKHEPKDAEMKRLKNDASTFKVDSWGELIKIIVISGIFGAIGFAIGKSSGGGVLLYTWLGAGFPWGYSVISKIIDGWVEVYMALASGWLWLITWVIKITLSALLGAIIMPIKLIISIVNIVKAHGYSKDVDSTIQAKNEAQEKENKMAQEAQVNSGSKKD